MSNQQRTNSLLEEILKRMDQIQADIAELKQARWFGLASQLPAISVDGPPPPRIEHPPFRTARPSAKHVRGLIFKQLFPDCERDAVQDPEFDFSQEFPDIAAVVDQLYNHTLHAADAVVAELQAAVGLDSYSWSDVSKDIRLQAYLSLETKARVHGVELGVCKDYWAAKCMVSTKWLNFYSYQLAKVNFVCSARRDN